MASLARTFKFSDNRGLGIVALVAAFVLVTALFAHFSVADRGHDWEHFFRPAALNLWDPYSVVGVFNPPWLFPLLLPVAWLPSHAGAALLAVLTLAVLIGYAKDWYKIAALLLSAPALSVLYFGQIDVIPLLALMAPAWAALPLLMVKPQGVFLAALRRLDRKSVAFMVLILVGSFLAWGAWPLDLLGAPGPGGPQNRSLFPWSLGFALGILAWLKTHPESEHADVLLCLASLAASPYWAVYSMLPMTALLIKGTKSRVGCFAICAATWGYTLLTQSA